MFPLKHLQGFWERIWDNNLKFLLFMLAVSLDTQNLVLKIEWFFWGGDFTLL